jgi:hypothetical protein
LDERDKILHAKKRVGKWNLINRLVTDGTVGRIWNKKLNDEIITVEGN